MVSEETTHVNCRRKKARHLTRLGYGLLVGAVAEPFLANMPAGAIGYVFGQAVVILALCIIVAGLVSLRRPPIVRAYAGVGVAAIALLLTGIPSFNAWRDAQASHQAERDLITSFMRATLESSQPSHAEAPSTQDSEAESQGANTKNVAFLITA